MKNHIFIIDGEVYYATFCQSLKIYSFPKHTYNQINEYDMPNQIVEANIM